MAAWVFPTVFVKALRYRSGVIVEHNAVPIIHCGRALVKSLSFINGLETFAKRRSECFSHY